LYLGPIFEWKDWGKIPQKIIGYSITVLPNIAKSRLTHFVLVVI
jgi:hypothetical protein